MRDHSLKVSGLYPKKLASRVHELFENVSDGSFRSEKEVLHHKVLSDTVRGEMVEESFDAFVELISKRKKRVCVRGTTRSGVD